MEKINDKYLGQSGGKIMETKAGKFIMVPEDVLEFDSEEEAKKAEKLFDYFLKHMPGNDHHHRGGPGGFRQGPSGGDGNWSGWGKGGFGSGGGQTSQQ